MLRRVHIKNFKNLRDVELPLGKLTLLVGENGSGKSSFLQALAILKASAGLQQVVTNLQFADLGPPADLVPPAGMCSIQVQGSPGHATLKEHVSDYEWTFAFDKDGYCGQEISLLLPDGRRIASTWARWGAPTLPMQQFDFHSIKSQFMFTNIIGRAFQAGGYGFTGQGESERQHAQADFELLNSLLATPGDEASHLEIISAPRAITESAFPLEPNPVPGFNPREGPIQAGAGLAANLLYNPGSSEKISEWESRLVNTRVQSRVTPGHKAEIRNPTKRTNYVNEGAGSGQLLFVFERLANCPDGATLGVEEPEIHLHPKAQYQLGELFGEVVGSLDRQLILTTHSPSVVSGVLSQVRAGKLQSTDVGISFLIGRDSGTIVTHSRVTQDGTVEGDALKSFAEASIVEASSFLASRPLK